MLIERKSEKQCHKNTPILQDSGNFIFSFSWIRLSYHSRNETGTNNFWKVSSRKVLPSCKIWWCFDLSLLPWNMDRVGSAHDHWSVNPQTQEIGILQLAASDEDRFDQNGKPSAPSFFIPSTYYYYPTNTIGVA